jgi:hypothetical protein
MGTLHLIRKYLKRLRASAYGSTTLWPDLILASISSRRKSLNSLADLCEPRFIAASMRSGDQGPVARAT